jgi:CubicO group peptidase (beta-lactamase class C family)
MLPDNTALRASHASLGDFLNCAAETKLDFPTASDCRYSSVGLLILGAIIEKTAGITLAEYLQREFFEPLEMKDSWLGIPETEADELLPTVLPSILPDWQTASADNSDEERVGFHAPDSNKTVVPTTADADSWSWNSRYWRTLGAPWGGMISSAADLGRYARMMLADGCSASGRRVLPSVVVRAAMKDQTSAMGDRSNLAGLRRPWGFGWRQQWSAHPASFGDFLSESAVGHWGATGTVLWIDPAAQQYAAILTTTPYEQSQSAIQRISNIVAAL